jgi:hypothetical protein
MFNYAFAEIVGLYRLTLGEEESEQVSELQPPTYHGDADHRSSWKRRELIIAEWGGS